MYTTFTSMISPREKDHNNTHSKNHCSTLLKIALAFAVTFASQHAVATASIATHYIKIDPVNETSYVFDENFDALPDHPLLPKTSIIALPADKILWYTGAVIDVVRRNSDGSIDILSDQPAYSEMIHHIVWGYQSPSRPRDYKCKIARPLASGSELNSIVFPKGYAYKLQGGVMMPVAWHWANPGSVSLDDELYIRFNVGIEDNPTAYKDVNIDWIDAVPCKSAFITPPGESKMLGPKHAVTTDRRIVGIIPHVHDHAKKFKLKSNEGTVQSFKPLNQNIPVAHDDMGQGPTPWHFGKDHLPVNGLSYWMPGEFGPIIRAGDSLWMESKFKNPHPRDIDNMAIAVIMWVPVTLPAEK